MGSFFDRFQLVATLTLIFAAPAGMALVSAPQTGQAAVLFDPRLEPAELMSRIAEADARIVRFGAAPGLAVVDMSDAGAAALRRAGAWLITDPILLGGCTASPAQDIDEG